MSTMLLCCAASSRPFQLTLGILGEVGARSGLKKDLVPRVSLGESCRGESSLLFLCRCCSLGAFLLSILIKVSVTVWLLPAGYCRTVTETEREEILLICWNLIGSPSRRDWVLNCMEGVSRLYQLTFEHIILNFDHNLSTCPAHKGLVWQCG